MPNSFPLFTNIPWRYPTPPSNSSLPFFLVSLDFPGPHLQYPVRTWCKGPLSPAVKVSPRPSCPVEVVSEGTAGSGRYGGALARRDPHVLMPGVLVPETWPILLFPNCLLAKLSGPRASRLRLAR